MAECKFMICVHNEPKFIEVQYTCLTRFVKQSFDMCVIDDSVDMSVSSDIKAVCVKLNIEYIRAPVVYGGQPSMRHATALQYGLEHTCKDGYTYFGTLDSDIFPVTPFDIDTVLGEHELMTPLQVRESIKYCWPGFAIWRTNTVNLHHHNWGYFLPNGDTGSSTHDYLSTHPTKILNPSLNNIHTNADTHVQLLPDTMRAFCIEDMEVAADMSTKHWTDVVTFGNAVWFHFRAISNWYGFPTEYMKGKLTRFYNAIYAHLKSTTVVTA
jgi:hypothetical protein